MSGTSEDRRQVPKEVSDILTLGRTQAEYRVATSEEHRQNKDREQHKEHFLREAKSSMDVCQAKWDDYGQAAIDMNNHLRNIIKQSWLC